MGRERCFWIDSKDGRSQFRLRGDKRPDARTIRALQDMEEIARRSFGKELIVEEDRRTRRASESPNLASPRPANKRKKN